MSANLKAVPTLEPDFEQAAHFVACLTVHHPDHRHLTFQTFSESKAALARRKAYREKTGNKTADPLGRVLHGTLLENWDELVRLQREGAGIFVAVTAMDGKGRSRKNAVKARSLFTDHDDPTQDPLRRIACFPVLPSCVVESSEGKIHSYWFVSDVPLEEFTPLQKKLAARFDSDKAVTDLPRVMRLPGTYNLKKEPFLVHQYTERDDWKSGDLRTKAEIESSLTTKKVKLPERRKDGGRTIELLSYGGILRAAYAEHDEILALLTAANTIMLPPCDDDEVESLAERAAGYAAGPRTDGQEQTTRPLTDTGVAERFVDQYGQDAKYITLSRYWILWDGKRWQRDHLTRAAVLIKKTVRSIGREAEAVDDDDRRTAMRKFATRSEAAPRRKAALDLAQIECAMAPDQLDIDLDKIGVPNGVLDLKTGELRDAAREDYVTLSAGTAYDPAATCRNWLEYLNLFSGGDREWIGYMQRLAGYLLTGHVHERGLYLLFGYTGSGKSTFIKVMQHVLGDYSATLAVDFLLSGQRQGPTPPQIARLQGKRLAVASEVETTHGEQRWNTPLIKSITGDDRLEGRAMYAARAVEFDAQCKLLITSNALPKIRGAAVDESFLQRLNVVPFAVSLERDEQIGPFVTERLLPELPGILNWALAGCLDWQHGGLRAPESVVTASERYQQGMPADMPGKPTDNVAQWFAECCTTSAKAATTSDDLYPDYLRWVTHEATGFLATKDSFRKALRDQKGVAVKRVTAGNIYNIELKKPGPSF